MSVGVVRALHAAMERDGVPAEERGRQPVFVCGHSQGGIVAAALASVPPHEAEVNIVGILSTGGPNRRIRVRPDVVTVAITHDQDVVPSMDGSPDRAPDRRVAVGRSLVRPRNRPLYYAHSSSTYTETVRLLERKVRVTPWGRLASSMAALQDFLPTPGEATRVMHYEIWQDLLTPTAEGTDNQRPRDLLEASAQSSGRHLVDGGRDAHPSAHLAQGGVGVGHDLSFLREERAEAMRAERSARRRARATRGRRGAVTA